MIIDVVIKGCVVGITYKVFIGRAFLKKMLCINS